MSCPEPDPTQTRTEFSKSEPDPNRNLSRAGQPELFKLIPENAGHIQAIGPGSFCQVKAHALSATYACKGCSLLLPKASLTPSAHDLSRPFASDLGKFQLNFNMVELRTTKKT